MKVFKDFNLYKGMGQCIQTFSSISYLGYSKYIIEREFKILKHSFTNQDLPEENLFNLLILIDSLKTESIEIYNTNKIVLTTSKFNSHKITIRRSILKYKRCFPKYNAKFDELDFIFKTNDNEVCFTEFNTFLQNESDPFMIFILNSFIKAPSVVYNCYLTPFMP